MERQFTATVYIVDEGNGKVLLIKHKKLDKWLPPGGHIDPNETPPEAAIREAYEETGLRVELITQENVWIDEPNAKSLPRPFLCLLEEIPAHGNTPAHQHIDQIFVGRVVGGKEIINQNEIDGMRWFSWEELQDLTVEIEIFRETVTTVQAIYQLISPVYLNN